jgi:hypothetical protein
VRRSHRWRWPPAVSGFLALGIVLLTAACDSGSTIAAGKLSQLVLSEQDMPGFTTFYNGAQVRLDNQGTNRTDTSRFGREGGWIARLRPSDSAAATGPLVVESRADVFKTADGARSDFAAYRAELSATNAGDVKQFGVPGLAQDAMGVTFTQAGARPLRFFRIAWRDRNATASVTVEGFDGEITQDQAVALAQKQEKHIKGA